MPTGFWMMSSGRVDHRDTDHSQRRDRSGRGIKIPTDYRRGRKNGRR